MSWQKCPVCEGAGYVWAPISTHTTMRCDVCGGAKIISTRTGKPPEEAHAAPRDTQLLAEEMGAALKKFLKEKQDGQDQGAQD